MSVRYEDFIEIRPGVRSGKPCFKGTRITVYDVLEYLAGGTSEAQLLEECPVLTSEHVRAALAVDVFHHVPYEGHARIAEALHRCLRPGAVAGPWYPREGKSFRRLFPCIPFPDHKSIWQNENNVNNKSLSDWQCGPPAGVSTGPFVVLKLG